MLKPKKLQKGDTVAAVSLSWGGPGAFPSRYEIGKKQFEKRFDLSVEEMPNALKDPKWLYNNPKARAEDLHQAFVTDKYKAVISSIGGDDSIRLLPYLDLKLLQEHPKIFVGYSDTTVSHFVMHAAGLVSFYGPAFMTGFAENCGIHNYLSNSFERILFSSTPSELQQNTEGWTVEHLDWGTPQNQDKKRKLETTTSWKWIQGRGEVSGHLLGGCIEVMDWLRGTSVWPSNKTWNNALLFIETSEEGPSPEYVKRFLRCLGAMGILQSCAGILFGRPGGQIPASKFVEYDNAILQVVNEELGLLHLPIVTHMDFGHTDPILTIPYGVLARLDCENRTLTLLEAAVTD